MAFAGYGAQLPNNDRTNQLTGIPGLTRTQTHEEVETAPQISDSSSDSSPEDLARHNSKADKELKKELSRRESLVQDIARSWTRQSHVEGGEGNPFTASEDSHLNPASENFRAKDWAKSVVRMSKEAGTAMRSAGVCYEDLNVFGYGQATDYQKDVANVWLDAVDIPRRLMGYGQTRIDILRDFEGLVKSGEMLVVLGPPGSGCSTFLKTIAGETSGINVDDDAYFNYQGITAKEMHSYHRGEAIYTAEVDVHFPQLTVGDTLDFAAQARCPRDLPNGVSKATYTSHLRDVVMAMFGISHTINTRVGNDYVRGVSGGERKRVTIAEASLSGAPLQCWDNSTRGLDSANAVEFCRTLRTQTELFGHTAFVSIYQAPQSAYDFFDKALVLYEGRQIFFGRADAARAYFENLGFECPARQTTPDFLTSMTSPVERIIRPGFEGKAPRTPDEFATAWKASQARQALRADIDAYKTECPIGGQGADEFRAIKRAAQAKAQRKKSPFTISYMEQIKLCCKRGWKRLMADPSLTLSALFGNTVVSLVVGSVFFDLDETTGSFFGRGALLFLACLFNAFASALEILTLYAQRPIVEKHSRYALYHPSAEAISSMLCDLPYKFLNAITFNLPLYFMTNLRREAGAFFFFLLVTFLVTLAMSMVFRTIGSASRTLSQAMVPAALLILALVTFTGFVIPTDYMLGWCRWINYIDPLGYAFESLMVNEFHGREFPCSEFVPNPAVPGYGEGQVSSSNRACTTVGAVQGQLAVSGDAYVNSLYQYYNANKWRNVGITIAFIIFFLGTYIVFAEFTNAKRSKGEVLVFKRSHGRKHKVAHDAEAKPANSGPTTVTEKPGSSGQSDVTLATSGNVFHWKDVCYDVQIKNENRRILDNVAGWVKPGTMTALMGVSGAGKTTLLDVLADRTNVGVISGDILVNDNPRDASFQRKTGYVQQQDLHLSTTTVREALNFSALMRQPAHVSRAEKLAYVDEVIDMLEMQEYSEAVVGILGEGLNVEQRKRLTIGVELAAKPPVLLFVDEPTSGLDSQTSWSILNLLEKLARGGQAILCTIHQPSAMLFQRFDRLLFLAKGGRTVYFGDVGKNSDKMITYFENKGAAPCPPDANPAEWMLEVIGAAPGTSAKLDWPQTWLESPERVSVVDEIARLSRTPGDNTDLDSDPTKFNEFAASLPTQMWYVSKRVFEQYWRTPSYIYAKALLCTLVGLFIGFVFFNAPTTLQGMQNQMFAIFQVLTVFGQLVQQTMPHFVTQRDLYEVRERPSKTYDWKVFMLSQIFVELPWNTLSAVLLFFTWYYPIGLYNNAGDDLAERGLLMFLLIWTFLIFTATFTTFIIAGCETAENGGNIANLLFLLCLIFCGVLATPESLPGFWIFMYRVSPFTYLVGAMLSTAVANTAVVCAPNEFTIFSPSGGDTCKVYLESYIDAVGGYLTEESMNSTTECSFCTVSETNTYLAGVSSYYSERWRNFGIMWVYIIFNIFAALALYWLVRVPKKKSQKKA